MTDSKRVGLSHVSGGEFKPLDTLLVSTLYYWGSQQRAVRFLVPRRVRRVQLRHIRRILKLSSSDDQPTLASPEDRL